MEVYLNMVVILNFLVDLLLLLGTNRLSGFPARWKRLLPAALLGAAYSAICLLPSFRSLGSLPCRLVSLVGMAVIAFGWNRSTLKRTGIFLLMNLALGGLAAGFDRSNLPSLLFSALGMWLLCQAAFGTGVGEHSYIPVVLGRGDNRLELIALRDTGNTLRDPITGEPVLIISGAAAEKLTGLTAAQLAHPIETMADRQLPGLRLIPYHTVGQSGGMLLAMRFEYVKIGSEKRSALVAFAPQGLGEGTMYQALTGGAI